MGGGREERHRGLGNWVWLGSWGQWGLDPRKLDKGKKKGQGEEGRWKKWEFIIVEP